MLDLLGDPAVVIQARKILQTSSASTVNQRIALSILGQYGTTADLPLLKTFRSSPGPRLKTAAVFNIVQLQKR